MIEVVCAVLRRRAGGPVLLCRRSEGRSWAGFYEYPGGKVEQGETQESALQRELMEELHLLASAMRLGPPVAETTYGGGADGPALHLVALEVELLEGVQLPGEVPGESEWTVSGLPAHDDLAWVEPGRLLEYRVPPADVPISELLVRQTHGV